MKTFIKHKIIHELDLIIEYGRGEITIQHFLDLKNKEMKDLDFDVKYNYVVDFRWSETNITENELRTYVDMLKKQPFLWSKRSSALITSSPSHVVVATLYKILLEKFPVNYMVVSTLSKALAFLKVPKISYARVFEEIQILDSEYEILLKK